ncbi:MAG: hypothetical protein COA42_19200 [Alteromonadaceae bacterium]|nr:MAG: hypothetical protein COA42_19200 [Alteromonadaceae bacterium]
MINLKQFFNPKMCGLAFLVSMQLSIGGCTAIYKGTGDIILAAVEDVTVPYVLSTDDAEMQCAVSEGFIPFLYSFGRITADPEKLGIMLAYLAGTCEEAKATEEELRYLRALKTKNVLEAKDARIAQKRHLAKAATRQLAGYQKLVSVFGDPGGECLKFEYESQDEIYYLIGLLDGILAILNDVASETTANVPLDIAAKISRAAGCLDNERWWGVPGALQAAIWSTLPSSKPEGANIARVLNRSVKMGLKQGVRTVLIFEAIVYLGQGDTEQVKEVIRKHAKALVKTPSEPTMLALDTAARVMLLAISDRLWTEATGTRTPIGAYGTFWDDDQDEEEAIDIDDLL